MVGVVERLEVQAGRIVELTDELLTVLGVPNEKHGDAVPMEPTVTTLDNRAYRVEEATNNLSRVQERLEWALTEADKV